MKLKDKDIILGCLYRWTGGWSNHSVVRVLRYGGAGLWTVCGPLKTDVPYNHAYAADLSLPTTAQMQMWLAQNYSTEVSRRRLKTPNSK